MTGTRMPVTVTQPCTPPCTVVGPSAVLCALHVALAWPRPTMQEKHHSEQTSILLPLQDTSGSEQPLASTFCLNEMPHTVGTLCPCDNACPYQD